MATLKNNSNKTLFFTTSPRSPMRMIEEIRLLNEKFSDQKWDKQTQSDFAILLAKSDFFNGAVSLKSPDFSARDRINRSPKALGLVDLDSCIKLTNAGLKFIDPKNRRPEEILLRQLLKFQLPSPFHRSKTTEKSHYYIKPYLEILRLVRHFGSITFDEIKLFGLQLIDYRNFDTIVGKIENFRILKTQFKHNKKSNYKKFISETAYNVVYELYKSIIISGNTHIRETPGKKDTKDFLSTKLSNLRDYTDACFRYLRATQLVLISQSGKSLCINPNRTSEIDFILEKINREPIFIDDKEQYKEYLYDPNLPMLYSDNIDNLISEIEPFDKNIKTKKLSLDQLKNILQDYHNKEREKKLSENIANIKDYKQFDDILETYKNINQKDYFYDRALMLEYNTWRAMTMLDGGKIEPNFKFDDEGNPLSTASGNMPDIYCDYKEFGVIVEVTLQTGQKQYDNEGEPVARHLGLIKRRYSSVPIYCFFIAPSINNATIAYYYSLHKISISHYGGKSIIVPLSLDTFTKMIIDSRKVTYTPKPQQIKHIFEMSEKIAQESEDENQWYEKINRLALNWLETGNEKSL